MNLRTIVTTTTAVLLIAASVSARSRTESPREIPLANWNVPAVAGNSVVSNTVLSSPSTFVPITPCRVYDTRQGADAPAFAADETRTIDVNGGVCPDVPSTGAVAYSLNVTVVDSVGFGGFLTVWETGGTMPNASLINFDQTIHAIANASIVPAGTGGDVNVYSFIAADVIIDVNGYFVTSGGGGSTDVQSTIVTASTRCNLYGTNDGVVIPIAVGPTASDAIVVVTKNGGSEASVAPFDSNQVAVSFSTGTGTNHCLADHWVIHTLNGSPMTPNTKYSVMAIDP